MTALAAVGIFALGFVAGLAVAVQFVRGAFDHGIRTGRIAVHRLPGEPHSDFEE